MWEDFIKALPEGIFKTICLFTGQIVLSIFIFLTGNQISIIIISISDLLIVMWILYKKMKKELKENYNERLKDKDQIIAEKNITIESLQKSLGIKKKSADMGDPSNK